METSIFERQLDGALIHLSKQRPSDPGHAELHLLSMTFGRSLAPRVCLCLPVKLVNSGDEDVTSTLSRSYRFPKIFKGNTVSRRTSGRVRSSAFSFLVLLPSEVRCVTNRVNGAFHEHVYLSILCLFFLSGCRNRGSSMEGHYGLWVLPVKTPALCCGCRWKWRGTRLSCQQAK